MNKDKIQEAIDFCLGQIDTGLERFQTVFPGDASVNGIYPEVGNIGWTTAFWTGMLWLAYELTGEDKYKDVALKQVDDFYRRIVEKDDVAHHDMGFVYIPSCVAAYRLTGYEKAKEAAILAADNLCTRFQEKGQFIQAWGELGAKDNYRLIIDCLLNIPLLYWAYNQTGNKEYKRIADAHLNTSVNVVIRDDGSTYHTFFFDPETGAPVGGETAQGYSKDSIWARGQAWGVYGLALAYKYTKDENCKKNFMRVTDVFFDHLPQDNVPAWDMIFTDNETQKDTSAAVIATCGILEMKQLGVDLPQRYLDGVDKMMEALQDTCYIDVEGSSGILDHGVYSMPHNGGVDECTIWGDYYYMETLMRLKNPEWKTYWE